MTHLFINPIGGLANRMRAMASGIALARDLGLRATVVWPVTPDLNARFDDLFKPIDPNIEIIPVSFFKDRFCYDIPRKKNLYLSKLLKASRFDLCFTDGQNGNPIVQEIERGCSKIRSIKGSILVRSGLCFHDGTDALYSELFRPLDALAERACQLLHNETDVIGMHIRRTDNDKSIACSPDSLFFHTADQLLETNPRQHFYLASDDRQIKEEFLQKYGSSRIYFLDKTVCRSSLEGMQDALTEMLVLARCQKIYGSFWSSYSEAASILGGNELVQLKKD